MAEKNVAAKPKTENDRISIRMTRKDARQIGLLIKLRQQDIERSLNGCTKEVWKERILLQDSLEKLKARIMAQV
jgi:hypothetical protein